MNIAIALSLALSLFLIVYHHAAYPLLLKIMRLLHDRKNKAKENRNISKASHQTLGITIVIPAYNEEAFIEEKLNNLAFLDYPRNKLKIIVACDGCTDKTEHLAKQCLEQYPDVDIEVFSFMENRGKCRLLNDVVQHVKSDIVVFSDVSSLVSIDALQVCNKVFSNSDIGGVNGNYRFLNPYSEGEASYWKYQRNIKLGENQLGSILGAHGAFYAIRTHLFRELPESAINDDFIIPMRVIEQGYQVIYDERINAVELEPSSNDDNWKRRKRIGFGNIQQVFILKNLLLPRYKGVAFSFFSGKALRVFMPFLMIYALVTSIYCALIWPILIPVALAQVAIYLIAAFVELFSQLKVGRIPKLIHYLVAGHTANLLGAINFISNKKIQW
ncbi:glycosyltransferase family 2 protein [Agaribacterium sp. ZY112]|uniref:glycosyltransferase family 2 protein n=1 Tax=Agaribacterium sp. ZY112 TaxID=3233574 RepID=UPI003524A77D